MVKLTIKKALRWLIPILWFALVIFLSCQTGSESEKMTIMVAKTFFPAITPGSIYFGLRLFAHFGIHFVLSVLIYQAARYEVPQPASFTLICGFTVAICDELLQLCVTGRIFELSDIALNLAGIFTGIAIFVMFTPQQKTALL